MFTINNREPFSSKNTQSSGNMFEGKRLKELNLYLIYYELFPDISAYPDSVNVLDNISSDVRTPDKLIDGTNDTTDGGHMWLAPILPSIVSFR